MKAVAAHRGCEIDSVFDLARVLRVPDTTNYKGDPVPVICEPDVGKPVTVEAIRAALDQYGITEERPRARASGNGQGPAPEEYYSRACLINRVAKAARGSRNRTLFGATLDAAKQGDLDDDMIAALEGAADECGLSFDDGSESIRATMESALRTAEAQGYEPDANPFTKAKTRERARASRSATERDQEAPNDEDAREEPDPEPIPLTQRVDVPPWPVDALPKPVADMVNAEAEATQTDPAMPATAALSALSACTGGHAVIEIRSGWREPLNLYTVAIAEPGERKTPVQQAMVSPIYAAEDSLAAASRAARIEAETTKAVATRNAERLRNAAASATANDNTGEPAGRDEPSADGRAVRREPRSAAGAPAGRRQHHPREGGVAARRTGWPTGDHHR